MVRELVDKFGFPTLQSLRTFSFPQIQIELESPTVIEQLQALIDEESSISFKAIHVAYYLLVQIYCETNQIELANGDKLWLPSISLELIQAIGLGITQALNSPLGSFFDVFKNIMFLLQIPVSYVHCSSIVVLLG